MVGCWCDCLSGARCRLAYGPADATVSCFSKIQTGFTFLLLAHLGSPRKRAVKRVCVCVCVCQTPLRSKSKDGQFIHMCHGYIGQCGMSVCNAPDWPVSHYFLLREKSPLLCSLFPNYFGQPCSFHFSWFPCTLPFPVLSQQPLALKKWRG